MKLALLCITITVILGITFLTGFIMGAWSAIPPVLPAPIQVEYPTGQQVLAELNRYRNVNGLPEFELTEPLCNNITLRWNNYKINNSHEGFEEFAAKYHYGMKTAEILAPGNTAQETIKNWAASPSHDYMIKNYSKACVYSAEGFSVALLSN